MSEEVKSVVKVKPEDRIKPFPHPYPYFRNNYLLAAFLNSSGILVDNEIREDMINKFIKMLIRCGLNITMSYEEAKVARYICKVTQKKADQYERENNSLIYRFINLGMLGDGIKFMKEIVHFIYPNIEKDDLTENPLVEQSGLDRNIIEGLRSDLDSAKKTYGSLSGIFRKKKVFQGIADKYYDKFDHEPQVTYNKFMNENMLIKFRTLYNTNIIKEFNKTSGMDYDPNRIDTYYNYLPTDVQKKILSSDKIEKIMKSTDFVHALIDIVTWKYGKIALMFTGFVDYIDYVKSRESVEKFSEMEDLNVMDPTDDIKITYDNQVVGKDKVYEIINKYNFRAPQVKTDYIESLAFLYKDEHYDTAYFMAWAWHEIFDVLKEPDHKFTWDEYKDFVNKLRNEPGFKEGLRDDIKRNAEWSIKVEDNNIELYKINFLEARIKEFNHPEVTINTDKGRMHRFFNSVYCYALYQNLEKQLSGYLQGQQEKMLNYIWDVDEKKHYIIGPKNDKFGKYRLARPSWNVCGLATKRWSSGIHTFAPHTDVLRTFIVEPGTIGVYFDISAAEVRFIAYSSKEQNLIKLYEEGKDPYIVMSQKSHPDWDLTDPRHKANRFIYKSVVLGLLYGRGANSIATATNMNIEQVQETIKWFRTEFPTLNKFIRQKKEYAAKTGKIETILGDNLSCDIDRAFTQGINYVVQGGASVLLACGFSNIIQKLWRDDHIPVSPKVVIHDSFQITFPIKELIKVVGLIEVYFKQYLKDLSSVSLKYDLELWFNMRDKIHFSYNKDTGVIKFQGLEQDIDRLINEFVIPSNYTEYEKKIISDTHGWNTLERSLETGNMKIKEFYPELNFMIPNTCDLIVYSKGKPKE